MNKINSHRDLIVWQKSMDLCEKVYLATQDYPKIEIYGLTSQTRRCSVSIPSNVAEGYQRGHKAEYIQFLRIAFGSGAELETQLLIALRVGFLKQEKFDEVNGLLEEVMKMLNSLINKLEIRR
jgi:four helix bundle protein